MNTLCSALLMDKLEGVKEYFWPNQGLDLDSVGGIIASIICTSDIQIKVLQTYVEYLKYQKQ